MELSNNNREIQLSRHAQEEGTKLINTPEAQEIIAEYATKIYPSFVGDNTDPEYRKAIKKYFDEHCTEILKEKFDIRNEIWFFDAILMSGRINQIPQAYQGQFVEYCIKLMEYRHTPTNLIALAKAIDQYQIQISHQSKKELAHHILVQVNSAEKLNEPQILSIIGNPAEVVTEAQQEMKKMPTTSSNYWFFLKLLNAYQKYVNNTFDLINDLGVDIIVGFGLTRGDNGDHKKMFQDIVSSNDDRYVDLWVKILQEKGVNILFGLFVDTGGVNFDPNKNIVKALIKHFSQTPITVDDIATINLEAPVYASWFLLPIFIEIKKNGGDYSQIIKYLLTTDHKTSIQYAGFLFNLPDEEILSILLDVLKKWSDYIAIDVDVIEMMPRILELMEKPGQEESLEYFASHIVPHMDLSRFPKETANKIWQLLKRTGWAEYYTDEQSVRFMAGMEDAESNINEMLETSQYLSLSGLTQILTYIEDRAIRLNVKGDNVKVNIPLLKQKILETLEQKGGYFRDIAVLVMQLKDTETQIHEFDNNYHKQVLKTIDDNLLNYVSTDWLHNNYDMMIRDFIANKMASLDFFYKIIEVSIKGSESADAIFFIINDYYKELREVDFYKLYKIAQKYNVSDEFVKMLHTALITSSASLNGGIYTALLTQDQLQKIIDDGGYKAFSASFFVDNYFKDATKSESSFDVGVHKFTMTFDTQKVLGLYYSDAANANYFLTRAKKFEDKDVKKNMIEAASRTILTTDYIVYEPSIEEEPLVLNGAINYLPLSDNRKSWQDKNNLYNNVAKILKSNNLAAPENNLNKESTKNQLLQKELEDTKEFIVGNKQQDAMDILADLMGGKNTGGEKKIKILYNAQLSRGTNLHNIVVNLQNDQFQKATRDKQFGSLVLSYVIRRADYANFPDLIVAASKLPIFYSQRRKQIDADIRKQMADGTIVIHDYKELKRKIDEELKKIEAPTIPELLKIQEGVEFIPSSANNLSKFKNMMYKYSEGKDSDRIDDYVDRLSRQKGFADLEAAIIKPLQKVYEVNGNKYRIEILRKDDPLGMVLGERLLTGCCQKFGGAGQAAMERGYLRPDHAFSVLYREIDDIPVSQGILYYHIQENPVTVPVTNKMKLYKSLLNLDPAKEYYFENEVAGENKLFGWYSIKNEGGTISLAKAEDRYLLFDSIEFHDMFVKSTTIVDNNQLLKAWLKLYQNHYDIPDMKMGATSMDSMKKQKTEIEQAWKAFAKDLKEIYRTKMVSMGTGYTDFDIKGLPVTQENKYDGDGYSDADYSTDAKKTVRLALSKHGIKLSRTE